MDTPTRDLLLDQWMARLSGATELFVYTDPASNVEVVADEEGVIGPAVDVIHALVHRALDLMERRLWLPPLHS